MAEKRALIFSLVYYPRFIGGAEVAVKEITDRIDPSDIEFHMITLRNGNLPDVERIGNIVVHRIGFSADYGPLFTANKYLFPILASNKARHLHQMEHFDFIWSIMANHAGFAALFFKIARMDVPFVLTLQEGDPIEYILRKVRPVAKIFRMIFSHADRIQAISKFLADFGKKMGAKTEPLVIPNGVDVENFSKHVAPEVLAKIRGEINRAANDVFLITTGRLVKKNGVGDIISSLKYLPANVKLLIAGSGVLENDLKKQVALDKLDGRVIFKGFVPHDQLPAYLQACDIFIRPSLSEGFGNSFIEAMAAGIPVIATPVGGIVDFLRNKQTGLFCDVNSPQDIARKVQIYIQDKNLRDEIVDNAAHMVIDHYDWKTVAKDMKEKVFDSLTKI